jgi:hypothetical protein
VNIDLSVIRMAISQALSGQTARWTTDERRVRLFIAAVQKKTLEIASSGNVKALQDFAVESGALVSAGVTVAAKMQFPKDGIRALFGWDPYAEWRNQVRTFAASWNLDPIFIQEMGPKI